MRFSGIYKFDNWNRGLSWKNKLKTQNKQNNNAKLEVKVYGGPQLSQRKEIAHGEKKLLTAKRNCSRQKEIARGKKKLLAAKRNYSRQKEIAHGEKKLLMVKRNYSRRKEFLTVKRNSFRRKEIPHGKKENSKTPGWGRLVRVGSDCIMQHAILEHDVLQHLRAVFTLWRQVKIVEVSNPITLPHRQQTRPRQKEPDFCLDF